MKLQDTVTLPCDRETALAALDDSDDVLRQCIPGCQSPEQDAPGHMRATVAVKVGPVKARYAGEVRLTEIIPPDGHLLTGEGKGGVAGFAKGAALVSLEEAGPEETVLYDANADFGGELAQLGSRLLASSAQKLALQFFDSFRDCVSDTRTPTA